MAGSITTLGYCLVDPDNKATIGGSRIEVVQQLTKWKLDETNTLVVKVNGFDERKYHSYKVQEFSEKELSLDIIDFIFRKLLTDYNYKLFRDIGF